MGVDDLHAVVDIGGLIGIVFGDREIAGRNLTPWGIMPSNVNVSARIQWLRGYRTARSARRRQIASSTEAGQFPGQR